MKKLVLVMMTVLSVAGVLSAQNLPWDDVPSQSIQGTLGLQNGVIVLLSGNTVYHVPHLSRYVGFIDGLKEGAQVKIDGYTMGNGYIIPSKITVEGRDYDISGTYRAPSNGMMGYGSAYRGGSGRGHHGGNRYPGHQQGLRFW
jgi:hypothetical protein